MKKTAARATYPSTPRCTPFTRAHANTNPTATAAAANPARRPSAEATRAIGTA